MSETTKDSVLPIPAEHSEVALNFPEVKNMSSVTEVEELFNKQKMKRPIVIGDINQNPTYALWEWIDYLYDQNLE